MTRYQKGKTLVTVVTVVLVSAAVPAYASLGLQLTQTPDLFAGFIDVTYDSSTDMFAATGFAFELDDDGVGPAEGVQNGAFELDAVINGSGALTSGSLIFRGTIPALGFNSGTLLTGSLVDFGFPAQGGNPLEFAFDVTGGDAAGLYGNVPAGLILSGVSGFGGDFSTDFDNLDQGTPGTGAGIADAAPIVPLPSSLLLLLSGVGVILARPRPRT